MTLWLIEPQDPLIVRDGRPFNATPGARARSLPFPFPSTTAGRIRSRAGEDVNGVFDRSKIPDVKQITVRGPFLVELENSKPVTFLVPAPADALVFGNHNGLHRKWLHPITTSPGVANDNEHGLPYLVGQQFPNQEKPAKDAPAFWYWRNFETWLTDPSDDAAPYSSNKLGHNGPQSDQRVHVAIDPVNFAGIDGALFMTSGLTFWYRSKDKKVPTSNVSLTETKKLALAVDVDELNNLSVREGLVHLGGERRLMNLWQPQEFKLPEIPKTLIEKIKANDGYCRLILLTPTYFSNGWQPGQFGSTQGVTVTPQAAAVQKPTVVSGWDFELRHPKTSRRLVPAGSVFFVKVDGNIEQWVRDRWLQPWSDDLTLAQAGFGITAVGYWDGKPKPIQLPNQEDKNG